MQRLFDLSQFNHHYFAAERTFAMLLLYGVILGVFVGLTAIKPVESLLGLTPWITLKLVVVNYVQVMIATIWERSLGMSRRASVAFEISSIHINLFIIATFIVVGNNPLTPLWAFYLFYTCILANSFGFQTYLILVVAAAGLAPGLWFHLHGGFPENLHWYATCVFTFLGLWQYLFLGKQLKRTRRREEDSEELEHLQRITQEKERIARELHHGVGHQLASAICESRAARAKLLAEPRFLGPLRSSLTHVQEHLRLALGEVRQALWSLDVSSASLREVMSYIQRFFGDICQASNIQFTIDLSGGLEASEAALLTPHQKYTLFRQIQSAVSDGISAKCAAPIAVQIAMVKGQLHVYIHHHGMPEPLPYVAPHMNHNVARGQTRSSQQVTGLAAWSEPSEVQNSIAPPQPLSNESPPVKTSPRGDKQTIPTHQEAPNEKQSFGQRYFFDWRRVNFHYLLAERSSTMFLINLTLMTCLVGLISFEPIGEVLGLKVLPTIALLLLNFIPFACLTLFSRWIPHPSRLSGALTLVTAHINLFIIGAFIVLSGKPISPLWAFYVMYVGILVYAFGFQPYLLVLVIITGLAPGLWFCIVDRGVFQPAIWYSVGLFTFLGLWEYLYLGYQVASTRKLITRVEQLDHHKNLAREKERIAREIHDGLGAQLTGAILCSHVAQQQVQERSADQGQISPASLTKATQAIVNMHQRLLMAMAEVHIALGSLDTPCASFSQLEAGLQRLFADLCQAMEIRFSVDLSSVVKLNPQLSPTSEHHLLRVVQEAVINAIRHADASEVKVTARLSAGALRISVEDNGIGMPTLPRQSVPQDLIPGAVSGEENKGSGRNELADCGHRGAWLARSEESTFSSVCNGRATLPDRRAPEGSRQPEWSIYSCQSPRGSSRNKQIEARRSQARQRASAPAANDQGLLAVSRGSERGRKPRAARLRPRSRSGYFVTSPKGQGLSNMLRRAEELGGCLRFQVPSGGGTRVLLSMSLAGLACKDAPRV